jgi:hypothetical protein
LLKGVEYPITQSRYTFCREKALKRPAAERDCIAGGMKERYGFHCDSATIG